MLTYVYNTKVHKSTKITNFSLVLSRNPPGAASFYDDNAFSPDAYYQKEPQALQAQLLAHNNSLRAEVNTRLTSYQSRYKQDHAKNVRTTPVIEPGQLIYIDKPPFATS